VEAQLQGFELESGLPLDDQLPVQYGALGERFEKRGLELGKVPVQGLEVAALQKQLASVPKDENPEASHFGSKIQESPSGRASTSFASMGSTGGFRASSTPGS
jgi:hypothetical protein